MLLPFYILLFYFICNCFLGLCQTTYFFLNVSCSAEVKVISLTDSKR